MAVGVDQDEDIPADVSAAALRLQGESSSFADEFSGLPEIKKPEPNRPLVFREIIKNHKAQEVILGRGADMSQVDWQQLGKLRKDMRENLRPSAEEALKWNTDKGNAR